MQKLRLCPRFASRLAAVLGIIFALWLPQIAHAAGYSLSSDGYIVRPDGKRSFPLGIFDVSASKYATIKASGFQTIAQFWADSTEDRAFLQRMAELKMFGIVGIDSDQTLGSQASVQTFVRNYVSSLKGVASPLAYLLPDEFLTKNYSLSKLIGIKNAIKSVDPTALTLYDDWTLESAVNAKDAYDIFAWDAYPVGSQGESIESWRNNMWRIMSAIKPKPFWLTLQAYISPPGWTEPSKDELRTMAYTAIANGATGLIAYAYSYYPSGGAYNYPQFWQNLTNVMTELNSSLYIITKKDAARTVSSSVSGIDVKLKAANGKYYLIAANYKSGNKLAAGHYAGVAYPNVQFKIGGLGGGVVKTLKGDSSVTSRQMTAGTFSDSFPAYGARIYEITPQ